MHKIATEQYTSCGSSEDSVNAWRDDNFMNTKYTLRIPPSYILPMMTS